MAETVKAYDVADAFLRALGAPSTPAMRRAVAIWLRFESGGTIIGNNPWNLHSGTACPKTAGFCPGQGSLPGQIGNRYAGPGDQNVAVFATLDDGAAASANNLVRLAPSYGYGKVITAARAGDALGFLNALQQSSWSAGHYNFSKLTGAFGGTFDYNTTLTLRAPSGASASSLGTASSVGSATLASAENDKAKLEAALKAAGISTDPSHVLTEAEAIRLTRELYPLWRGGSLFEAGKTIETILGMTTLGTKGGEAIGELMEIPAFLGNLAGVIFDPENWKYLGALAIGLPLTLVGFYLLAGVPTGGRNA